MIEILKLHVFVWRFETRKTLKHKVWSCGTIQMRMFKLRKITKWRVWSFGKLQMKALGPRLQMKILRLRKALNEDVGDFGSSGGSCPWIFPNLPVWGSLAITRRNRKGKGNLPLPLNILKEQETHQARALTKKCFAICFSSFYIVVMCPWHKWILCQ